MSGLVNGLQNRLRRFESARHLIIEESHNDSLSFFPLFTGVSRDLLIYYCIKEFQNLPKFTLLYKKLGKLHSPTPEF